MGVVMEEHQEAVVAMVAAAMAAVAMAAVVMVAACKK